MNGSSSIKRIGLYGPWGYGNLGCAATLQAMIDNIRDQVPNAEIVCFSLNPKDTQERHGVATYPIARRDWREYASTGASLSMRLANWLRSQPFPLFRRVERWVRRVPLEFGILRQTYNHLKRLDAIVITGGGQLLDFWGGAWTHPYWLGKYALLSKLAGTKLMFVSVGAGPLDSRLSRIFCKTALRLSTYRSYRDDASKKFVETTIGFRKDDPIYPDLAYSLRTGVQTRPTPPRPVVGLGVMAYCDGRHWPESNATVYREYLEKLAAFAQWLVDKHYVISLLVGESYYDKFAVKDLVAILTAKDGWSHKSAMMSEETIVTVPELLQQIAQTDFIVASRLHNVLLATLLHKPVIALSYHPKIDALMSDAGQGRYCLPVRQFDVRTLKERFIDLEASGEAIRQHFEGLVQSHRVALEQQYGRVFQQF